MSVSDEVLAVIGEFRSDTIRMGEAILALRKAQGVPGSEPVAHWSVTNGIITFGASNQALAMMREQQHGLLFAAPPASQSAPEGFVLVPREPTMGMWDDFCAVFPVRFDLFILAYKAMCKAAQESAAPVAPEAGPGERGRDDG